MKPAASQCLGMFLSHYGETVVVHAFRVAVQADPHVTPAANPPAVQCNQADDMQYGVPLWGVPLTASSDREPLAGGGLGWASIDLPQRPL